MTWFSHKILTASFVFSVTGSGIAALFAAVGSVLPDALEGVPNAKNSNDMRAWRNRHRKITHWFVPYLVSAICLLFFSRSRGVKGVDIAAVGYFFQLHNNEFQYAIISFVIAFIAVGALLHCLQDAICGTIPSFNPSKRIGKRFFVVRSPDEYVLVGLLSTMLLYLRLK